MGIHARGACLSLLQAVGGCAPLAVRREVSRAPCAAWHQLRVALCDSAQWELCVCTRRELLQGAVGGTVRSGVGTSSEGDGGRMWSGEGGRPLPSSRACGRNACKAHNAMAWRARKACRVCVGGLCARCAAVRLRGCARLAAWHRLAVHALGRATEGRHGHLRGGGVTARRRRQSCTGRAPGVGAGAHVCVWHPHVHACACPRAVGVRARARAVLWARVWLGGGDRTTSP